MSTDLEMYGEPEAVAPEAEKPRCRFGDFVVPEGSHIKFGDVRAEKNRPAVWELDVYEEFRPR